MAINYGVTKNVIFIFSSRHRPTCSIETLITTALNKSLVHIRSTQDYLDEVGGFVALYFYNVYRKL